MMLILAQNVPPQVSGSWLWGAVGVAVGLGAILFCWNQLMRALDRFSGKSATPQPMNVEIVKALHEQFADKKVFDALVEHNTKRHGELFSAIERVERKAREAMEHRFTALNDERRETLEKLNEQFTFIREHIAAINRELQIRNK
jgi:hypothetical protein